MMFDSSRRKLARGKEHIRDLEREVGLFLQLNPYKRVFELNAERPGEFTCKIRLIQSLPSSLEMITGDAVTNLRAVLDHAMFAISRASGVNDPHNAYFPFSHSAETFENNMRGRCKDVPQEIYPFLRSLQPYPGGNTVLCILNDLCNADKHRILTPIGTGALRQGFSIRCNAIDRYFRAPIHHAWDRAKQEMVLFSVGGWQPGDELDYEFDFHLFVALNEVQTVDGQPAVPVLNKLASEVERILSALEAEASRLGIGS